MVSQTAPGRNGGPVPAAGVADAPPPDRPEVFDLLTASRAAAAAHPAYAAAERIKTSLDEAADACRRFAAVYGPDAIRKDLTARGLLGPGLLPDDFAYTHAEIAQMAYLLDVLSDRICLDTSKPDADGTVEFPSQARTRGAV